MSEHQLRERAVADAESAVGPIVGLVLAISQDADRSMQPVGQILLEMARTMDAELAERDAKLVDLARVAHGHANVLQRLVLQS